MKRMYSKYTFENCRYKGANRIQIQIYFVRMEWGIWLKSSVSETNRIWNDSWDMLNVGDLFISWYYNDRGAACQCWLSITCCDGHHGGVHVTQLSPPAILDTILRQPPTMSEPVVMCREWSEDHWHADLMSWQHESCSSHNSDSGHTCQADKSKLWTDIFCWVNQAILRTR